MRACMDLAMKMFCCQKAKNCFITKYRLIVIRAVNEARLPDTYRRPWA